MRHPAAAPLARAIGSVALAALALVYGPADAQQRWQAEVDVTLAFTPRDDAERLIVETLDGARDSVQVQAYVFTSRRLSAALVAAHRRGVRVQVLADRDMVFARNARTRIPDLHKAGIPVRLEVDFRSAHNKVMVVDAARTDCAVITGSYNFTVAAQRSNAENLLVLRGHRPLCQAYADNWQAHNQKAIAY